MSDLGDLLELMHGAAGRFERVTCEYRTWRHDERLGEAFRADADRQGSTMVAVGLVAGEPQPPEHEERVRYWVQRPDKVREEQVAGGRAGSYAVAVGEVWWSYDEHHGAMTNAGDERVGRGVGQELEAFLDPARFLPALVLRVVDQGKRAGRRVILATATPRPGGKHDFFFGLHALGSGADEYELEVDADVGVVLRAEARRSDEPFLVHEAVSIDFDTAIPPETFVFEPPPGEEIETFEPWRPMHHIPLHEAVRAVPFKVFVPERVPAEWELTVTVHTERRRPPIDASVHLHYRSRDSTSGVGISQTKESDRDAGAYFDNAPEAREVKRSGFTMRVRSRTETWPQSQLELVRDGTAISINSQELDGEALVRLADSLVPAPSEPPAV